MADRKSLFSRFWPASGSRRTPPTQTTAPRPAITGSPSKDKPQPISQTSATSAAPPTAENRSLARRSGTTAGGSPPAATTQPPTNQQTNDQPSSKSTEPRKSPSGKEQTATRPTTSSRTKATDEPKTTSPSCAATQSPSSSKPPSPNRLVAQSGSPPQPLSTPQKAPQPRLNSHSPKQGSTSSSKRTQHTSPPKESRQPTQKISRPHDAPILAPNEKNPKPAASQREPETKAEVKSDGTNDIKGQTLDGAIKHDDVEPKPSQSSEVGSEKPAPSKSLDSSTIKGEGKPPLVDLNAKLDESKEVKEVAQATNTKPSEETKKKVRDPLTSNSGAEPQIIEKEANEDTKKEVNDSLSAKSGSEAQIVEKPVILSKPDQMQRQKQEVIRTKESLATSLPNATFSQPKKRSTISGTHNKSAVPHGEHVPFHKNIKDNMSTFVNQMTVGDPKGDDNDRHVNVITLAGDNRGASMQMDSNSLIRDRPVHIHRSYKINPDETGEATSDGEGSSDRRKSGDANPTDDETTEAYVNNNSQGINNSIVFSSSVTEGDPGVHLIITHLPKEQIQSTDKANRPEARKAESNMSRAEKHTYQPTIRRRCLRGLLLETSDSDPDNPEKPRRHGCRVGYQKSDQENNIDVL